jgi:hypothetical protein
VPRLPAAAAAGLREPRFGPRRRRPVDALRGPERRRAVLGHARQVVLRVRALGLAAVAAAAAGGLARLRIFEAVLRARGGARGRSPAPRRPCARA